MTDYIVSILTDIDDLYDEFTPRPQPSVLMTEYNDRRAYLYSGDDPAWAGSYIVGAWTDNGLQLGQSYDTQEPPQVIGVPTYPLHEDYTTNIRPLGNDQGRATGLLDSLRWAGHPEAKYLQDDNRYNDTNAPFTMVVTRTGHGQDAQAWDTNATYGEGEYATSGGMWLSLQDNNQGNTPYGGSPFWEFINQPGPWGWRAEIFSDDPLRDITARAIAIYSDPEWTAYLFTTGAFALDPDTGLYTSVCPIAQRTAAPEPIYYSLLWGSLQEGNSALTAAQDGSELSRLHWAGDQGSGSNFYAEEPNGANTNSVPQQPHYSPNGYEVVELRTSGPNRIVLKLENDAYDGTDPTITMYLPSGIEIIPLVWQGTRYLSGLETGIRTKVQDVGSFKVQIKLTWV